MTRAGRRWAPPVAEPLFNYRLRPGSMSTSLERMWRVGLGVIERSGAEPAAIARAQRGWTLRHIARAAARADRALLARLVQSLGSWREDDIDTLTGALRWAFAREDLAGPARAAALAEAWRSRIASALEGQPVLAPILARFDAGPARWERAVRTASGRLGAGDPLVIYGMGRNGHEAAAAARRLGIPLAFADDNPRAVPPDPAVARIAPARLGRGHVVLVTPDDRAAILATLRSRGVQHIVLPDAA
jgi:hypothetical protein